MTMDDRRGTMDERTKKQKMAVNEKDEEKMMNKKENKKRINSVRDLEVYKKAFEAAMEVFEISKNFPKEEKYSLTDQVRRSSRSVCTNLAEGWRKRRYKAVFINKLSDAEQEAAETQTWLEFAWKCNYIDEEIFKKLDDKYEHVFAMLITMERKVDTFCK